MFDILFGWRKASKCKKLIRRVQCRLKLLKNKRCSIVRQLREDVAEILRHGHDQIAFDRVEQLFKDESIVAVYDLLDHFCEFIIIHLSYIRRHKDCPNDINEAVSSLIFASARCGDLPELRVIRKLFGERYGQRFAMTALDLLPGNLVNRQIKENLSIKSVSDDVKYKLVDDIARSCHQAGPLALEYCSELQQLQANKSIGDEVPNSNRTEGSQMRASESTDREEKIVFVNFLSSGKKLLTKPFHSRQDSDTTDSSTVVHSSPNTVEASMHKKEGKVEKCTQLNSPYELTVSGPSITGSWSSSTTSTVTWEPKERNIAAESSSESSSQLPEEMIYLDDIEEFQSPSSKDGNCQDQRLFKFKSSALPNSEKFEGSEKTGSRKSGKAAGKRLRRLVSWESSSAKEVECAIYHGQRKHQKKIPIDEIQDSYCVQQRVEQPCCLKIENNFRSGKFRSFDQKNTCCSFNSEMVKNCSLEHPCYFYITDDKDDRERSPWKQKKRMTTLEGFPIHLKEENMQHGICHCHCSHNGEPNNQEMRWAFLPLKPRENNVATMVKVGGEAEEPDYLGTGSSSMVISPRTRIEMEPPYLRAMTMPPERPKESCDDNILRSNSFPFRHVHPKLPDYDELAAKFMALKNANLQNKHH